MQTQAISDQATVFAKLPYSSFSKFRLLFPRLVIAEYAPLRRFSMWP